MEKEKIIEILKKSDSTLLSFPDRGPWGDNRYRGNCSGYIHAFCIWKYKVRKLSELFAGGGTGYDVSKDMEIEYVGADLNPTPVRPNILVTNALENEVPEEFLDSDFLFMHPPYGLEINIPYAGSMYPDPTGELSKSDLAQMPWDIFIQKLNSCIMKYYAAQPPGARLGVLMGDVRRGGFHSMLTDIVKPGELQQIIIKAQHNFLSKGKTYANKNFVPIQHEYLMICKKPGGLIVSFQLPTLIKKDIRDSNVSTWRDVVASVLHSLGGKCCLEEIYNSVEGHIKCERNPHWKEKIRQTLQVNKCFRNIERGVWAVA